MIRWLARRLFSERTRHFMHLDLMRARARFRHQRGRKRRTPPFDRLHFGCGTRKTEGWFNVDVTSSNYDIDLCSRLPWVDGCFSAIVSQHTIEHLDLTTELEPLMHELRRVAAPGAEIWLTCPDMEKVCRDYIETRGRTLRDDREARLRQFRLGDVPSQHMINLLFTHSGGHQNLFDFEMLSWLLRKTGFGDCQRQNEAAFLARFPEFKPRHDDLQALYVSAVAVQPDRVDRVDPIDPDANPVSPSGIS